MTAESVVAIIALAAAFGIGVAASTRIEIRRGLGLGSPVVAWLVVTALFFAAGAVVLAIGGRPAAAAYTAGGVAAFGLGGLASDALSRRRAPAPTLEAGAQPPATDPAPIRAWAVALLAALGIVAVAPTLLRTGLPFLVNDITGARAELAGLPVQLLRVTLPAAAAVALAWALRGGSPAGRWASVAAVVAIAAFEVLLASRYLLAELAATLTLTWLLTGHRIGLRVAVGGAAIALVAFAGLQLLRAYDQAQGRELEFVVERTINRVVLIQPRTLDALMTVIPAEHDHFLGLTWVRRIAELLGRDDVPNLGYWIYPRVVEGVQATAGYAAPGWLGEAWANFGWAGLALFVGLGAALERLAALIATRRATTSGALAPADVVAAALLTLFAARTHALGVNGAIVAFVIVAGWRLLVAPPDGLGRDVARTLGWRT